MVVFIGLAGGSGSGKTTIARKIKKSFLEDERVTILELDSYYKDFNHLTEKERARVNFDHPSSLDFDLLEEHLLDLQAGKSIEQPIYDFVHHQRRKETISLKSSDIIILEGILTFHNPTIRNLLDIKIFIDTDADIRILRRLRRDIEERGRTFEDIKRQYHETVRPMHLKFVEPTKQCADIVIPEGGNRIVATHVLITMIEHKLNASSPTIENLRQHHTFKANEYQPSL